jgi:uncharacterized protein DUF3592
MKTILVGLLVMAGGFWFWYSLVGNPLYDLALIRHGVTAKGEIVEASEDVEDDDRGRAVWTHNARYRFTLPSGRTITRDTGSLPGRLSESLPRNIEVEYLSHDPSVSRIKGSGSQTVFEWAWRKAGLGALLLAMFLSPGAKLIHSGIGELRKGPSRQTV